MEPVRRPDSHREQLANVDVMGPVRGPRADKRCPEPDELVREDAELVRRMGERLVRSAVEEPAVGADVVRIEDVGPGTPRWPRGLVGETSVGIRVVPEQGVGAVLRRNGYRLAVDD